MNRIKQAWDMAVRMEHERVGEQKLDELKTQGYDTCKLCGDRVNVYGDDGWQDIFDRLAMHAAERDDHIQIDGTWEYVPDEPRANPLAEKGLRVATRAVVLFLGFLVVAVAGRAMGVGWLYDDVFFVVAAGVSGVLGVIAVAGLIVAWYFQDSPYTLTRNP